MYEFLSQFFQCVCLVLLAAMFWPQRNPLALLVLLFAMLSMALEIYRFAH